MSRCLSSSKMLPDLRLSLKGLGGKVRELQVRPPYIVIKEKQPREIHRSVVVEDLILIQLEVDAEALDDLFICSALDLQAYGVALAAVVELDADGF